MLAEIANLTAERRASDGSFCWQSKKVRRLIREAFDSTNNVTTALAVYDALTEIASDNQRETFNTTHAWIQRISGVGITTIKKHLAVFSDMKLLAVSTPVVRAPSTYTLLSDSQPPANDSQRLTNDSQPAANDSQRAKIQPVATSEESQKNLGKEEKKAPPTHVEWLQHADELKWPHADANRAFNYYEANGWRQRGGNPIKNWKAAARNCQSRGANTDGHPASPAIRLGKNLRN